jgi:hypothetical protein
MSDSLYSTGVSDSPVIVRSGIANSAFGPPLLALPFGSRPLRSLVDYQNLGLERILDVQRELTVEIFTKMGMESLLTVKTNATTGV